MKRLLVILLVLTTTVSYGADVKISNLPAVTTLEDTDVMPAVAGTTTSKITISNLKTVFSNHAAVTLSTTLGANLLGLSTQQLTLDDQTANYVFAGPTTGEAAAPSFRALVAADIPSLVATYQPLNATLTALAAQTETAGSIQYYTDAATPAVLAIGTAYQVLNTNSGATAPTWTSTLGATDTRLTKIWATDLEITNAPTINGAALTTILQPLNDDLTTLSAGGTANCLWGEKSDSSGIECKTTLNLQLDDSAAQFKSATASKGTLKFDQTGITDTKLVTVKYTATDSYTYTPTLVGNVSHLLGTTWTNGKWCSYSTSTGLTCNEDAPAGTGDMTTDAIWDAKGDLAVGTGANTAAKLAIGTAYQVLHVATDTPGWTSTLGATGTRLTKIWATDLEVTNAPTVNGAALTTILQPLDGELTALAGLTSAANAIPYFTGSGTAGVISSSADMVYLLGSADYATALTNLGGWGVSGSITDEQLVCAETTGGSNLLKSCGAKITYTEPATNTTLCRTGSATTGACTNPVKLASFAWDGGASAVATASSKRCTIIPTTATVTGVYAIADASTTTHIHVYQDAFATGARSTTVTGAVDISATLGSQDTTLTGWDKSITAGDEICMSVEENDNAKWLTVTVYGTY